MAPQSIPASKLDGFCRRGSMSDRQWRDVVGILRIHRPSMVLDYPRSSASEIRLTDQVNVALHQAAGAEQQVRNPTSSVCHT